MVVHGRCRALLNFPCWKFNCGLDMRVDSSDKLFILLILQKQKHVECAEHQKHISRSSGLDHVIWMRKLSQTYKMSISLDLYESLNGVPLKSLISNILAQKSLISKI